MGNEEGIITQKQGYYRYCHLIRTKTKRVGGKIFLEWEHEFSGNWYCKVDGMKHPHYWFIDTEAQDMCTEKRLTYHRYSREEYCCCPSKDLGMDEIPDRFIKDASSTLGISMAFLAIIINFL